MFQGFSIYITGNGYDLLNRDPSMAMMAFDKIYISAENLNWYMQKTTGVIEAFCSSVYSFA